VTLRNYEHRAELVTELSRSVVSSSVTFRTPFNKIPDQGRNDVGYNTFN